MTKNNIKEKKEREMLKGKISNCCQSNVFAVDCDEDDNCRIVCGNCGANCGFRSKPNQPPN